MYVVFVRGFFSVCFVFTYVLPCTYVVAVMMHAYTMRPVRTNYVRLLLLVEHSTNSTYSWVYAILEITRKRTNTPYRVISRMHCISCSGGHAYLVRAGRRSILKGLRPYVLRYGTVSYRYQYYRKLYTIRSVILTAVSSHARGLFLNIFSNILYAVGSKIAEKRGAQKREASCLRCLVSSLSSM